MKGKRKGISTKTPRRKRKVLRRAGLLRAGDWADSPGAYHDVLLARMSMRLAPSTNANMTTEMEEPYPTR